MIRMGSFLGSLRLDFATSLTVLAAAVLPALSGCGTTLSGNDGSTMEAGQGDGSTTDTMPTLSSVTFRVEHRNGPLAYTRAEGALVAFDGPDGVRHEAMTDASGLVRFDGIDWSRGVASVTAYLRGYEMFSYVRMPREEFDRVTADGQILLRLRPQGAPAVAAMGSAANMNAATDYLLVTASAFRGARTDGLGPDFRTGVYRGVPYRLVALDYADEGTQYRELLNRRLHAWAVTPEFPGVTTDTNVRIDFNTDRVTPTVSSGSFRVPTDQIFFQTGYVDVRVFNVPTLTQVGISRSYRQNLQTGEATYTIESVEFPGATHYATEFFTYNESGEYSYVYVPGRTVSGPQDIRWLVPPQVEVPAEPDIATATVRFENTDNTAMPTLWIHRVGLGRRWTAFGARGATEITLPALPTGVTNLMAFGRGELRGQVTLCDGTEFPEDVCNRGAVSAPFSMVAPRE